LPETQLVFHYMPEYIRSAERRVFSDSPMPAGKTIIHTAGLGNASAKAIPWAVGNFTGFYPRGNDPRAFQRGVADNVYGSTAVQLQGITIAMHIHSYSAPRVSSIYRPALAYHAFDQHVYPWRYGTSARLCVDHYAAVPSSWTGDGSINYSYAAIAVHDMFSDRPLWIAASHYDSRGMMVEQPVWWPEERIAIALGYYGGERYTSLLPGSSRTTGETWNHWRYFGFSIARQQLQALVTDVNSRFEHKYSTNPDDYLLLLYNVGPEMYVPPGTNGHMAMRIAGIRVYTQYEEE